MNLRRDRRRSRPKILDASLRAVIFSAPSRVGTNHRSKAERAEEENSRPPRIPRLAIWILRRSRKGETRRRADLRSRRGKRFPPIQGIHRRTSIQTSRVLASLRGALPGLGTLDRSKRRTAAAVPLVVPTNLGSPPPIGPRVRRLGFSEERINVMRVEARGCSQLPSRLSR